MSKELFDVIKRIKGKPLTQADVDAVNAELERGLEYGERRPFQPIPTPPAPSICRRISQRGIDLIHSFESLILTAYKDPGSVNGLPITIGWGTTVGEDGRAIKLGETWNPAKANRMFARDMEVFEKAVEKLVGDAATQNQFDALVSFGYNVGTGDGGLKTSTLLRKHLEGDYEGAANEFARWNKNDGKPMKGLTRRRAAEASLYRSV